MKEESRLPELRDKVSELVKVEKQQDREFYLRVQGFSKILNEEVEAEKMQEHPFVKNVYYLPISFMEATLDSLFFGLWETVNFKWERILNEIVASVELRIYHPVMKQWITRTGVAAIDIKVDKMPDELKKELSKQDQNGWYIDPSNKKPMALTMGSFATLKAYCFKNACQSIGKYFGRDSNRNIEAQYTAFLKDDRDQIMKLRKRVSDILEIIQDEDERAKVRNEVLEAEASNKATAKFYNSIIVQYERNE